MRATTKGSLRLFSEGGNALSRVVDFLSTINHTYNSILYFTKIIDSYKHQVDELPPPYPPLELWRPPHFRYHRYRPSLLITPEEIGVTVHPLQRLILDRARLESPGFWEFFGQLNILETIRKYLNDRHTRRQDHEYREYSEKRRLDIENEILESGLIKEKIVIARQLGATDEDLAPLLNQLVIEPLKQLDKFQDSGEITGSETEQ